jgi:hypothetical protein
MDRRELEPGDVVQLNPEYHLGDKKGFFAGCFMIVDEAREWGCQGHVLCPRERGLVPGAAYYRARWDEMEFVGKAVWKIGHPATNLVSEDSLALQ